MPSLFQGNFGHTGLRSMVACRSTRWRPQLGDANDEMVLEAAVNGRAQALVMHNVRDFAKGVDKFGVRVLRPGELPKELRS